MTRSDDGMKAETVPERTFSEPGGGMSAAVRRNS